MDENQKKIVEELKNKIFIIEEYTSSKKEYQNFINHIYDLIKAGFEIREFRTTPVYFKFRENDEIRVMELRHFVVNLMFWKPFVVLNVYSDVCSTMIVDATKLTSSYIESYINNLIIKPYRRTINNTKMNLLLDDMIHQLSRISTDFNIILGIGISTESFIDVAEKNERFNEIIRTKIDENMQPQEIEELIKKLTDEEVEILKNTPNDLQPMLLVGSGIRTQQLGEFSILGGLKPSLEGNTIPTPINSNLLVGGLSSVTNYFIDSTGGRKSLIMNNDSMGTSGHFSRKVMMLSTDVNLREDAEPCGSLHAVSIEIKSAAYLKKLIGRYYRTETSTRYRVLLDTDTHLIGQTILLKSPITCASKKGICHQCYGEDLSLINTDMSIGSYAAAIFTNPVSQAILSSKHLLTTISEKIVFGEDFYKFFTLAANEIFPNILNDEIDLSDYSLVFIHENIVFLTNLDEGDISEFISLFHVKNNKTGEMTEISELGGKDIYLSPNVSNMLDVRKSKKEIYEVKFSDLPDDERIFVLEVDNNELTRPLKNIMSVLDTKNRRAAMGVETIDQIAQKLLDLVIESKINVQSVHCEIIIHPMIRSKKDVLERPNFRKYNAIDDYQILTVEGALEKHPSVLIGLSFQFLDRQFKSPLTFKKTALSYVDPFFKERP